MSSLLVRDLMTEKVYSVHPDDDLVRLVDLMADIHIRHVPVVDAERVVVGLVSQRDLIREALNVSGDLPFSETREFLKSKDVRSIMTTEVETVEPDTKIEDAGQTMLDNKLGCLPVTEGDRLVGILTEADFVKFTVGMAQRSPPA
jgi:CBS domain-containing membrane protein